MYANSYYNDMPGKEKKRGGGRGGPRADAGPPAAAPGPAPVAAVARTAGTDGPAGGPPQAAPAQRPMFDPALDPERRPRMTDMVRNIDIGAGAFNVDFEVRIHSHSVPLCLLLHAMFAHSLFRCIKHLVRRIDSCWTHVVCQCYVAFREKQATAQTIFALLVKPCEDLNTCKVDC